VAAVSSLYLRIDEKRFPAVGQAEDRLVIQGLELRIASGDFAVLIGPSGCGKTTLLNIVAGLDRSFVGELRLPESDRPGGPHIGYVFQNPRLLPWKTVLQNIHLVMTEAQRRSGAAEDLLHVMGLWESRHFYPTRLSLGMQRRVALARAYAVEPDILLMDEPFVSLDESTAHRLRLLLIELWQSRPTTVLFVTHDLREAIMLGDRLIVLAPRPSRVLAETPVEIPRGQREDVPEVERLRGQVIRTYPSVFEGLA
jgi:ABC-type nitrate/sulfonate/bicarbonate transport system ATPase subunit